MGNILKFAWRHRFRYLVPRFFSWNQTLIITLKKKLRKSRYETFDVLSNFIGFLYFLPNYWPSFVFLELWQFSLKRDLTKYPNIKYICTWGYSDNGRLEWVRDRILAWESLIKIWETLLKISWETLIPSQKYPQLNITNRAQGSIKIILQHHHLSYWWFKKTRCNWNRKFSNDIPILESIDVL